MGLKNLGEGRPLCSLSFLPVKRDGRMRGTVVNGYICYRLDLRTTAEKMNGGDIKKPQSKDRGRDNILGTTLNYIGEVKSPYELF